MEASGKWTKEEDESVRRSLARAKRPRGRVVARLAKKLLRSDLAICKRWVKLRARERGGEAVMGKKFVKEFDLKMPFDDSPEKRPASPVSRDGPRWKCRTGRITGAEQKGDNVSKTDDRKEQMPESAGTEASGASAGSVDAIRRGLLEQVGVCLGQMPKDYVEMDRMLWGAFQRGRDYQRHVESRL